MGPFGRGAQAGPGTAGKEGPAVLAAAHARLLAACRHRPQSLALLGLLWDTILVWET